MSGLKYGLNIQKKPPLGAPKAAQIKKKTIFDDDEDDPGVGEDYVDDDAPQASHKGSKGKSSTTLGPPSLKAKCATAGNTSDLATRLVLEKRRTEAAELDPTVYDYDSAYDALHAKTAIKQATEREDALERRPKYMKNLLAAAEVRKRDQLRAKDRLLQLERENEGSDFADKEKFVTEAYKAQQEEVRKAEEAERIREEEEAKKRRGKGMTGFYKSVMDDEERAHQQLLVAAEEVKKGQVPAAEAQDDEQSAEKTAAQQAREMNAQGAKVIINDEGQVADKRQLLSAGLNIAPKPKPSTNGQLAAHLQRGAGMQANRGRNDAQRATRERQTRMMEAQLEQATKRAAEDEAEERVKIERAAKSRKTESDVSGAKERYLQRKREAAVAAAAAVAGREDG